MGTGGILPPTRYLFIDGGYLRECYARFAKAWFVNADKENQELKFETITHSMFKSFYYDCLDEIKKKTESEDELRERVNKQEQQFNRIQAVKGCHVQLGKITGEGGRKRQKEVDILLAVDMMNHAIRQNMGHAFLLAGDRDFRPVVKSLVDLGIFVTVRGDVRNTAVELRQGADDFHPLHFDDYMSWTPDEIKKNYSTPTQHNAVLPNNVKLVKSGKAGKYPLNVSEGNSLFYAYVTKQPHDYLYNFPDFDRLIVYVELLHGKVVWD